MVRKLTQMDAAISLLLVGQQAQTQSNPPFFHGDKLEESASTAEEFIAKQSEHEGLKMVRYIYGEEKAPEPRHDRRRGWWGWEI
ncbi:MAG: hypothetical protein JWM68_618 [Verrucomicrobiales bacterium]|nr:hypothetical protein [Verrucomicrobiales bacterium]